MKARLTNLVLMFLVCSGAAAQTQTIKIGVFDHAPLVVLQGQKVDGGEIRYLNKVCREMGITPVYTVLPFPRLLNAVETGEIDMALELRKTPEREAKMLFSEKPVIRYSPVLAVLTENKLKAITQIDDLQGYKIAYLIGSTVPDFLKSKTAVTFDSTSGDDWGNRNLKKLLEKRVDGALDLNPFSTSWEIKKMGVQNKVRILTLPGPSDAFYVVFSKTAKGTEFSKSFDKLAPKLGTTLENEITLFVQQN